MATARELAQQFITAAQKKPEDRAAIFRDAAYTFMGLAHDKKYARAHGQLTRIGLDFARAAERERPIVVDDFTDLLKETHDAYQEVGDDPMELVARRREIHDHRDPGRSTQILITPESFNKDVTLGRQANIKGDPSLDDIKQGILQRQNVAFWQGSKKESQAMTVDVTLLSLPPVPSDFVAPILPVIDPNPPATAPPHQRMWAEVEYGADGNRTTVRFDLGRGRRFTVPGNYIAVSVGIDFPSQVITAGASIGAFAATSPAPLIKTEYVDDMAADGGNSFQLVTVPLKAVQLLPILSTLGNGGTAVFRFLNSAGGVEYETFYTNSAATPQAPIPLTQEIAYIQVINTTMASGTYSFRLPFQLSM